MRKSFGNKLRILLDEGIDKEEFHVVDSRFCSQAISGMINWGFMWFNQNGRFTILEASHQMATLVTQMVTAKLTLPNRSEENKSELQSLMRISYDVFCLKKKKTKTNIYQILHITTKTETTI